MNRDQVEGTARDVAGKVARGRCAWTVTGAPDFAALSMTATIDRSA